MSSCPAEPPRCRHSRPSPVEIAYQGFEKLVPEHAATTDAPQIDPLIDRATTAVAEHRDVYFTHRFPGEELLADAIAHSCGGGGRRLDRHHTRALRKSWNLDDG